MTALVRIFSLAPSFLANEAKKPVFFVEVWHGLQSAFFSKIDTVALTQMNYFLLCVATHCAQQEIYYSIN